MEQKWKQVLIAPDSSIRDALKIIDQASLRIALVVSEAQQLLGVVTDGDIRRGLLKNFSLDSPVSAVMNAHPVTAQTGTSRRELIKLMNDKGLLSIPLLENGKVVDLEILQRKLPEFRHDNPVFLMAGGFGTRLKPLTNDCPKPMLKVGDKPILELVLLSFIRSGFHNFYISLHYMPEQIQQYFGDGSKWNVSIKYIYEDLPLGTAGALGLLPPDAPKLPVLLMNGDLLTTVDFEQLLEFHNKSRSDATMCVRDYEYQIPFGVINGDGERVLSMVEKPIQRLFVNAGIYVINPEVRAQVKPNQRIDMPTLLEQNIELTKKVSMFPIHEYWLDIGRIDDYQRAQIDVHNLRLPA
ncbi:MAG TPA: alcohol dehydrogenase [Rheinheimera sp.]|uniref:nucleotidyltransferase family protein n=1 Tax=Rheinheimera sp. TaxID=1869214 RepID=UPI000EC38D31|nr:nucleotidyltransferase family protein [Rheinheimera sp.]HCU66610.1 alcohol dehydrogenase [Rheinheimera sp.]